MEDKSLSKSISDFSKKLSRFNDSSTKEPVKPLSQNQRLQQKIDEVEALRKERIVKQYSVYANPVSQQIEEDEGLLLSAYNLFSQVFELNENTGDSQTKLKDLRIKSPLCSKSEYVSGSGFSFLRIWFIKSQSEVKFIPIISQDGEQRYLEFISADEYSFSKFEKELLQLI